ncbi:MAG: hypothetical protein ACKODC_00335 [Limnohabitans sp.]
MEALLNHTDSLSCVVVAVLVDFMKSHQGWGWMRLVAGASAYKSVPGLMSAKVMGSGHGGGFSLRPSATHQGLLCRFENADRAMDFLHGEQVQGYRERSRECWGGVLAVTSSRGHWDQQAWGTSEKAHTRLSPSWQERLPTENASAPLAVLTRASIQPAKAMAFWRHAPATQQSLDAAKGCLLAMGLGEAPLVRQCTLSLWKDEVSMLQFAAQGAHQQASIAAYRHQFFSESLFVRLRVLRMTGRWKGHDFGNGLGWSGAVHA